MQTLHTHLFPVAAMLLLSIVSCSSDTKTDQTNTPLADSNLLLSETGGDEVISRNNQAQANAQLSGGSTQDSMNSGAANQGLRINPSNYEQLAQSAAKAINLTELNTERDHARVLLAKLNQAGWAVVAGESGLPGLTLASQEDVSGESGHADYSQSFICDEGGLLTVLLKDFHGGPFYNYSANFDDCQLDGQTYNGNLESSGARRAPDLTVFSGYTRTSPGLSIDITGEHEQLYPFFGNMESNAWTDTSVAVTNSAGTVRIDNLNWQEQGLDTARQNTSQEDSTHGFVLLPDGTVHRVAQYSYSADLQASFDFTPAQVPGKSINVVVNLGYLSQYFNWEGHFQSGFDVPTFPVSDLGTTIDVYSEYDIHGGTSQLFNSQPKDPTPQWQDGDVRITASDSSSLVLKPDSTDVDAVLIELNGSGEQMSRLWTQGYQVACPVNMGKFG